ncbi:hypothetical protein AXG93_2891s1270 [Marchantia polymorpha subsp. ruderalis]|uniref:P-type ATPase A domain-containing protein n=1 Tax=Marchantia polymorpha subsp. ruderalis TaxID=1480154 RepID=A0A176WND8_MARPO|nr:hypothetical protein AXG93_2891s1270 [Marchantia polymorpha subsp. ruderalis]
MFVWREERFWYNDQDGSWTRRSFNVDVTYADLQSVAHDCAVKEMRYDTVKSQKCDARRKRLLVYGPNVLTVEVSNFGRLLMTEVFKPFFVFQVISVSVWMYQDYRIYASVILGMTVVSVLYNVFETRRNLKAVQKLAASECLVKRLTLSTNKAADIGFKKVTISSSELLPGDIVEVEAGMSFPCDLVLLAGQCVVNESMLTGESAPVPKTPLPSGSSAFGQVFQSKSDRDRRHMLLSGTLAIQIRGSSDPRMHQMSGSDGSDQHASIWQFLGLQHSQAASSSTKEDTAPVAAMVISTAYGTAKGHLVRAIRFPKPSKYNFERKLYHFVANSAIYLVVVCAATIYFQVGKESAMTIFEACINLVTIAVPAALPLALSIGISVSFNRLQGKGVYCINPGRILSLGRVDTLCFDKTGTITEDGLNLKGVVVVKKCENETLNTTMGCGELEKDPHAVFLQGQQALLVRSSVGDSADRNSVSSLGLFYTLAACHDISLLDHMETGSGIAKGDEIKKVIGVKISAEWLRRFPTVCREFFSKNSYANPSDTTIVEHDPRIVQERYQFIGDPLEIQMFTSTGWRYMARPFEEISPSVRRPDSPTHWTNALSAVDTVIMPPTEVDSKPLLAVLRKFTFDSEIRIMSTIVLELPSIDSTLDDARSWILVKAPHGDVYSLQEICVPESLPHDFHSQLQTLTAEGYRVLACAYRLLGSMTIPQMMVAKRKHMESELIFSGFLVMENKLKPETSGVLLQLAKAGLREIMVTGDNPFTAAAVARQSGPYFLKPGCRTYLLDQVPDSNPERYKSRCVLTSFDTEGRSEIDVDTFLLPQPTDAGSSNYQTSGGSGGAVNLVVTGRAFYALLQQHEHLVERYTERTGSTPVKIMECITPLHMVLTQAGIFSRMSPQHKMELMRSLQDLGYVVCMTGDGANDSGALKAADVGISIASKPAASTDTMAAGPSIAAPFSTKLAHIGVVPMVLAEGRCALVSATVMFKYMFFYGMTQATSVIVLYRLRLELFDNQYLLVDLGLVFPLVLLMPATHPRKELTHGRPEGNLLTFPILISVYGQSVFIMAFQVIAQVYLEQQSWYERANDENADRFDWQYNQNTTVSFLFASFQYVATALTLSQSFGLFRNSVLSNWPLTATLICQFVLSSLLLLKKMRFVSKLFGLVDLTQHWHFLLGLWLLAVGNSLLFVVFERYAVFHKSTELDMSDTPRGEAGPGGSANAAGLDRMRRLLRGQETFCLPGRPVVRDFFQVAEVAGPLWAQLS